MIKHLSLLSLLVLLLAACSYTMKSQVGEMAADRNQYVVAVNMPMKKYRKNETSSAKVKIAYLIDNASVLLKTGSNAFI